MDLKNRLRKAEQQAAQSTPQEWTLTYWHDNGDGSYTEGQPDAHYLPGERTISHAELRALGGIVVVYTESWHDDPPALATLRGVTVDDL